MHVPGSTVNGSSPTANICHTRINPATQHAPPPAMIPQIAPMMMPAMIPIITSSNGPRRRPISAPINPPKRPTIPPRIKKPAIAPIIDKNIINGSISKTIRDKQMKILKNILKGKNIKYEVARIVMKQIRRIITKQAAKHDTGGGRQTNVIHATITPQHVTMQIVPTHIVAVNTLIFSLSPDILHRHTFYINICSFFALFFLLFRHIA